MIAIKFIGSGRFVMQSIVVEIEGEVLSALGRFLAKRPGKQVVGGRSR
jgi:hypothetical protein